MLKSDKNLSIINIINIVADDGLATLGASPSAVMVLPQFPQNVLC